MSLSPPRTRAGWRAWEYIPTSFTALGENNTTESFKIAFGIIPKTLLPTSKFQIFSPISNCQLSTPWSRMTIAGDAFPIAISGGLTGALGGIGMAQIILAEKDNVTYSLTSSSGQGPKVAYCVGDKFSERIYVSVTAMKNPITGGTIVMDILQDVMQRYKLSRFLLHHGQIQNYYASNDPEKKEEYVSLGITNLPESALKLTPSMTLYKNNGKTLQINIKGFLANGDAIIEPATSTDTAPASGDFYILDKPYFLDDPFLLAGLWYGTEADNTTSGVQEEESGFNLPVISNQYFYTEAKFIGGYGLVNKETGEAKAGGVGAPMTDSGEDVWAWWLRDPNDINSDSYKDTKNRPSITYVYEETPKDQKDASPVDESKYIPRATIRKTCKKEDVLFGVKNKQTSHVRLEINRCGSTNRNNFHAPILQNEFVIQNDKYFKILAQVDGATIDVSYYAVDGKTELNLDGKISILCQYEWKIIEHYSGNNMEVYGRGKVKSITQTEDKTTLTIDVDKAFMSNGTDGAIRGGGWTYLPQNSFHKRFITKYVNSASKTENMYEKGQGWYISNIYDLTKKFIGSKLLSVDDSDINITKLKIEGPRTDTLTENAQIVIYFDEPYPKEGPYRGGTNIREDNSTSDAICLLGNLLSPYVEQALPNYLLFGICDSLYWNLGGSLLGNIAMFFMSTPEGYLGLSSCFSYVPEEENILFSDYISKKVALRTGSIDFSEYPLKSEIALGLPLPKSINSSEIKLDTEQDRVSGLNIELPKAEDSADKGFITIRVGEKQNFYGTEISGNGQVKLRVLDDADISVESDAFKNGDSIISPVCIYKAGFNSINNHIYVPVSVNTDVGNLYLMSGIKDDSPVKNAGGFINYVNESQSINFLSGCEIFVMPDGERIILYNKRIVYEIDINEQKNNSGSNNTAWAFSNTCIMIAGMNGGYLWGTPFKKTPENKDGIYGIPIMLANCCEMLCATYSKLSCTLYVFAKCYNNDGVPYIGLFNINYNDIFSAPIKETTDADGNKTEVQNPYMLFGKPSSSPCTSKSVKYEDLKDDDMPFWFRPVKLGEHYKDKDFTYTATGNIPKLGVEDPPLVDLFTRVYGLKGTKSKIEGDSWGTPSCYLSSAGHILLFIDSPVGIKMLYSYDQGHSWTLSKVILAKDGTNGFMIDDKKFYYLSPGQGIMEKDIDMRSLQTFMYLTSADNIEGGEGKQKENIEEIQKEVDAITPKPLGSGVINSQKFSGHVTGSGSRKIFFYDSNGYLSCLYTNDSIAWDVANNF